MFLMLNVLLLIVLVFFNLAIHMLLLVALRPLDGEERQYKNVINKNNNNMPKYIQ